MLSLIGTRTALQAKFVRAVAKATEASAPLPAINYLLGQPNHIFKNTGCFQNCAVAVSSQTLQTRSIFPQVCSVPIMSSGKGQVGAVVKVLSARGPGEQPPDKADKTDLDTPTVLSQ